MEDYLRPTAVIDSDSPHIQQFASSLVRPEMPLKEKAVRLYYAVRDQIKYDPYGLQLTRDYMRASSTLKRGSGFCVAKAILYAALLRSQHIPSRLGFADVRNHLTTPQLKQYMQTDVFVYHGYTEILIDQRWVKATPVFNIDLCRKFGVQAMDFDGQNDCLFHAFDCQGRLHMEYLQNHGTHADLPLEELIAAYRKTYPQLVADYALGRVQGDFEKEADAGDVCK